MRISDWSSDVCSSDLKIVGEPRAEQRQRMAEGGAAVIFVGVARHAEVGVIAILLAPACVIAGGEDMAVRRRTEPRVLDRKGVVEGKSVSVRVDLGGRRIINNIHNSN